MVWPTHMNDKQLRPQIHFPIQKGTHQKTQHPAKSIYGLSPPNRWTLQTKEAMGRTILTACNLKQP